MNKNKRIVPIILAGGLGKRLRPVVKNLPKVISLVNKKPFITYIFEQLIEEGYEEVILLIGYKGNLVKKCLGMKYKNLTIKYLSEDIPLGTGGAVKNIAKKINFEYLLVINGDTYHNCSRKKLIKKLHSNNDVILCSHKKNIERFGLVEIDKDYRVITLNEKQNNKTEGLINIGSYLINREYIANFKDDLFSLEENYFPRRILDKKLFAAVDNGNFIDIGVPSDYFFANKYFQNLI